MASLVPADRALAAGDRFAAEIASLREAALSELAISAGLIGRLAHEGEIAAIADCGWYDPELGAVPAPDLAHASYLPTAAVVFYRSYLTSADTAPIDELIRQLRGRGFEAIGLFAPSLKDPRAGGWLRDALALLRPALILNATAFSARGADGQSPLDMTGCPVFQVALSTSRRDDWAGSDRGLAPADLAMHVVLPEVDGRIFAGVISFKTPSPRDPELQFSRFVHYADKDRIAAVVARVAGWHRLAMTAAGDRRLALVLSTYPGKAHQMAHAVGLDAVASTEAILGELAANGYRVTPGSGIGRTLVDANSGSSTLSWSLKDYLAALDTLPPSRREALFAAWGDPTSDAAFRDGAFHFTAVTRGHALIALQPERGDVSGRNADYHDLARTPRHAYVAFYLWLRAEGLHALVHVGAHGTLEWLPGKSVALSENCWPELLTGPLPVVYPFIVNDPGEAAQAKRRIGAVTLGHLPPPLVPSAVPP
ncbi:MAG: cobaltochelatase subunit CobN, partial [Hyphomicrobium sp.]